MKKHHLLLLAVLVVLLSSCVLNQNVTDCVDGKTYGFWYGLWHGIIAPIDLVLMIFNEKYAVFAANNSGAWYAFGFILGSGGWGLLGANRRSKK
ncbi:MAG: hypothetical protein ACERKD_19090 [Prolixibacteraceae bacterium]